MKKVLSITLVLVLLVSVLPVTAFAASGTSRYDAIPVVFEQPYTHTWTANNDEQDHYISFTMPSRGLIAMACTYPIDDGGDCGDMLFEIYNQSGTCIWRTATDYESKDEGIAILCTGLNAGKFYMNITPEFTVVSGEFEIAYALTFVAADNTVGTEAEPNNSKTMADTLTVGKEFAGTIGEYCGDLDCDYDYWKYSNTSAVGYRVYFPELAYFKPDGKISHEDSAGNITNIGLTKDAKQTADGIYYFEVKSTKGTNYLRLENDGGALVPYTIWIEPFANETVKITKQPVSVAVSEYQTARVSVAATGDMLSYAWYVKDYGSTEFALSSVVANEYSVSMRDNTNCQQVYCVITDVYGNTVQSDTVTLSMLKIKKNPKEVLVAAGETAVVQLEAMGDGLTYQWYAKNKGDTEFTPATGFTESTYSVTMDASVSGRQLYCVVTDRFGNTAKTTSVAIAIPEHIRETGTCGDGVNWELTYNGILTISGTGPMQDYAEQQDRPWNPYRNTVKKIVVEDGVTRIGSGAFWYCENAQTATLPNSVTSIGENAFSFCGAIAEIDLPDNLKIIGKNAFNACKSITAMHIPESVTEIHYAAFSGCTSLQEVNWPKNITVITECVFASCDSLSLFIIPDGVTTIETGAFLYTDNLRRVVIPASVTSIGRHAFASCDKLSAVYYGGTDRSAITIDQYNDELLEATWYYGYDGGDLTIPGDIDGNGEVNSDDVVQLLLHISMPDLFPITVNADYTGDGKVTSDDVVQLLLHISMPDLFPLQ